MRAARLVAVKDLRLQIRRRTVLVLGLVAPLALTFALNLVFGGFGDDSDVPVTFDVGLVDLDGGAAADRFESVVTDLAEVGLLDVEALPGEAAARSAVNDGDVQAVWVVPEGFSDAVASGARTSLRVIADVDAPLARDVAEAVADRFAAEVGVATLAAAVAVETGAVAPAQAGEVTEAAASTEPLVAVVEAETGLGGLDVTTTLTAAITLFFAFYAAGLPLLSVLEERSTGTLARLLVAPIPAASIIVGKVAVAIVLGFSSMATMAVASTVLMGASWGPSAGVALLLFAAVVAVTGIMVAAGATVRTPEQAGNVQSIVAVVLAIAGGTFTPFGSRGSEAVAVVRRLTPNGWFIDGLTALVDDGVGAALPAVGVLLVMGLATGSVGLALARGSLR